MKLSDSAFIGETAKSLNQPEGCNVLSRITWDPTSIIGGLSSGLVGKGTLITTLFGTDFSVSDWSSSLTTVSTASALDCVMPSQFTERGHTHTGSLDALRWNAPNIAQTWYTPEGLKRSLGMAEATKWDHTNNG